MSENIYCKNADGSETRTLDEFFPFLREKGHNISLVGAGGKTTLMYAMAECAARSGKSVLVTTTTHIPRPERYSWTNDAAQLEAIWQRWGIAVLGKKSVNQKLESPSLVDLVEGIDRADLTLLEADGARGFPCKVPGPWEPVLIPISDIVVGVMGMDAIGKPLEECCFGQEQAMKLLGVKKDHCMTEEDLALILSSERGTRRLAGERDYYVALNKCDSSQAVCSARRIEELLRAQGIRQVVLTCFMTPASRQLF